MSRDFHFYIAARGPWKQNTFWFREFMPKLKMRKPSTRRTTRTDHILRFRQKYIGDLHQSPKVYNLAFAGVLREMADALEAIENAWADPQVVIWSHEPGLITAELPLSEPVRNKKKRIARQ